MWNSHGMNKNQFEIAILPSIEIDTIVSNLGKILYNMR